MRAIRRSALFAVLFAALLAAGFPAWSQDQGGSIKTDEGDLFGGDEVVESPSQAPKLGADPLQAALKTASTRLGGFFSGSLTPSLTWSDLWGGTSTLLDPETRGLSASLKSTIFFDARPKEDFRVYGSFKTSWPFSTTSTVLTGATTSGSLTIPNIKVFELFADFNYGDLLFFRFGKSTVKWGVGYFWSPADVINLERIDLFDAEAQREGPISLRLHLPVPGTQNNFYLYTILDKDTIAYETTALAAKAEFLLGSYELGLGAYYRHDTAERAMLTLTGPLGDLDLFGEAMVSRGSAQSFVTSIGSGSPYTIVSSSVSDHRDRFYFSASAGASYASPKDNLNLVAQYYYNGEGYADSDRTALISSAKTALATATFLGQTSSAAALSRALAGLVYGSGRHYAAASLSKGELIGKKVSGSLLAIANLSDGSGIVKPSLSWKPLDYLSLSLSPSFVFGPSDGEYVFLLGGGKDVVTLSLGLTVSGSF